MAVGDAEPQALERTLRSLRRQRGGWSLTVVTTEDRVTQIRALVHSATAFRDRRRIRVLAAGGLGSDRDLMGIGIEANRGASRALLFPGDVWAPDAVALLSAALTPTSVVYADQDEVTQDGEPRAPQFKPDFSPDFLLSSAYIGRPLAIGATVADQLPRLVASGTEALEHECALRATEAADAVIHIPEVLCHRSNGTIAEDGPMSVRHIQEVLRDRTEEAAVEAGPVPRSLSHLAAGENRDPREHPDPVSR